MKRTNIQFLTRTAMLLAIVIVIQMVGRLLPNSNFVVGPLVNACLLISVALIGLKGGVIISIAAPFTSLINNHAPIATALLPFAPFVALGNFVFVVIFYFLMKKNKIAGVIAGSVIKFAFLYGAINAFLYVFDFPKFAKILLTLFSWPQLITAIIGGFVALAVIKVLEKNFK